MPASERITDPYEILLSFLNKNVRILLKDKHELVGFIVGAIRDNNEISGWKLVSNNQAIEYKKTAADNLLQTIAHTHIESIEKI